MLQSSREALRQDIQRQVRQAVEQARAASINAAQSGQQVGKLATPQAPTATTAPVALPPVPVGGGRLIIDRQGDRTVITSAQLPPDVIPLTQMAQETALGLVGLLAAMVILGPFARAFARRITKRTELESASGNTHVLQQQLLQLQQSVDAMSLEVERISESQRFQSKLLNEARQAPTGDR